MESNRTVRGSVTFQDIATGIFWPRLFRAGPLAVRPSRLAVALVTLAAIMVAGGLFDAVRGRPLGAAGFTSDAPSAERVEQNLRGIALDASLVGPEDAQRLREKEKLTIGEVRAAVARKWRAAWAGFEPGQKSSAEFVGRARAPYDGAMSSLKDLRGRGVFETAASDAARSWNALAHAVVRADVAGAGGAAAQWWTLSVGPMFGRFPVSASILVALAAALASLGGGAIARSAACDMAGWPTPSAGDALVFAARRRRDLTWSLLGPAALVVGIALLLAFAGAALLRVPALDVVGGALYGVALLLGALAVFIAFAFALGGAMVAPAVAVECTDWLDALQRSYAYVTGKTGRLAAYALLLLVMACVWYFVLALFVTATLNFTAGATGAWAGVRAAPLAGGAAVWDFTVQRDAWTLSGTDAAAAGLMGVWERVAVALLAAFVFSYLFCGGTALYLVARRINDNQDIADISMDDEQAAMYAGFESETTVAAGAGGSAGGEPAAVGDADDE